MADPTFRLEGVVKTSDDMEDFEGPLTLILQLLSKNKIEIQDIKIADILDQYLAYLDEMKSMDLEVASEFVSMASHLVYIKARMLLHEGEGEVTELEQLISSLEKLRNKDVYVRIKAVLDTFGEMSHTGLGCCVKPPEPIEPDMEYHYQHDKNDLLTAMLNVFKNNDSDAARNPRPFVMPTRIVYPVPDKAHEIVDKLRELGSLRIKSLFEACKSRSELVATFVALLELCKSGGVMLTGEGDECMADSTGNISDDIFGEME
jgi:segregation and condensation protein A